MTKENKRALSGLGFSVGEEDRDGLESGYRSISFDDLAELIRITWDQNNEISRLFQNAVRIEPNMYFSKEELLQKVSDCK